MEEKTKITYKEDQAKRISNATAYARQYAYEQDTSIGQVSSGFFVNKNRVVEMFGHKVMITFEEDCKGTWSKRVRIFPDIYGSLVPSAIDAIMAEVDSKMKPECLVFSRPMDDEDDKE